LRRKLAKITAWSFLVVFLIILVGFGVFAWKLSQGPMAISFLNERIEQAINSQLKDMKVKLGTAVLELDARSYVPHVRFRNLVLSDFSGAVIASAPRAAVTLDSSALWNGQIAASSLELIGPKISARRNIDGSVELGVGGQDPGAGESLISESGKSDRVGNDNPGMTNQTSGAKLIAILDDRSADGALSSLLDIRVSAATISVYDDANSANWFAPSADLTFKKMPYGFVILAKADVETHGTQSFQ
jgi:hypothetical protein